MSGGRRDRSALTTGQRVAIIASLSVVSLGAAGVYGIQVLGEHQERTSGASAARVSDTLPDGPQVVFRNMATGQGYGMMSSVALSDPDGPRTVSDQPCDRVDATDHLVSCLRTIRGVPTTFETNVLTPDGELVTTWPLAGIPSRTRVSDDGLVASTAFVTGHSYATDTFSTETTVKGPDGRDFGSIQDFDMTIEGRPLLAVDRNVWGVTFAGGDRFYATVASGGRTWLVEGDFAARTLSSVAEGAECPSVSPDGSRVAYKVVRAGTGTASTPVHWDIAVLDLATGSETVIELERGIDDQLEWLDDEYLLYGLPRLDAPGDADVYRILPEAGAEPQLFIEHAWSPSVVH